MTKKNPRGIAALIGSHTKTYRGMAHDVDAVAVWLAGQWKGDWRHVGVCMHHRYWHWVVNLALLRLGVAAASVMDPERTRNVVSWDVWLTDTPLTMAEPVIALDSSVLEALVGSSQAEPSQFVESDGGLHLKIHPSAERMLLTSGTTGQPHVVRIPAVDLAARLEAAMVQYEGAITSATRLLGLMGIDTLGGFFITLVTWMKGGTVLFGVPSGSGSGQVQVPYLASNLLSLSPASLLDLVNRSNEAWPGRESRVIRVGGSRLHPRVRDEALRKLGGQVISTYGATETGLVATCDAMALDRAPGIAGKVYPNVQVQVVDERDNPLPAGVQGRIRCRAPGMARGYHGGEPGSAFVDGWFYPGDVGTLTDDGWLAITGRNDDLLNLGGHKLSAVDLESMIQNEPGVLDVCVVSVDVAGADRVAVALVLGASANPDAISAVVTARLPWGVPFVLARMPALPRNAMGKLERGAVVKQVRPALERGVNQAQRP